MRLRFGRIQHLLDRFAQLALRIEHELRRRDHALAGLEPADVDVALLYDCFTIVVLLQLEDYGFCGIGEGGPFVAEGKKKEGALALFRDASVSTAPVLTSKTTTAP